MAAGNPVLLFDGVCNLCNGFVQFIIKRDTKGIFRFTSLQSDIGQQLMKDHGFPTDELNTVILIKNGQVYTHSDAPLQIARHLSFPWPLFSIFAIVPKMIRDRIYDWVARNRYKWYGKKDSCMIPTPELKSRFL
jgi:predicted DCC family thiol-disulfide oxidoreductase YuxK